VTVVLSSDSLYGRVRALQKKQRSGNVAPPTPRTSTLSRRSVEVPDFTPLPRRPSPRTRPTLPIPVEDAPFKDLASNVPASLLAPRYSHLLEEAATVCEERSGSSSQDSSDAAIRGEHQASCRQPASIGNRVKGFLFSYLPTRTKRPSPLNSKPCRPRLPLPPPEILGKPRGPIVTPIRPPAPKPTHPKELVHLQAAPPPKVSMIPRIAKPQRLVNLHHIPFPESNDGVSISRNRNRRSSGGSVKDLIRSFELEDSSSKGREDLNMCDLQRARSIEDWRHWEKSKKPIWRP
jgi:hypothetical protein